MVSNKSLKFEDLEVWKLSQTLFLELSDIFYLKSFHNYSFQDQIMRAAISISNNIAEGYGRGGKKELIRFLFIAKGSCEEVKNMIYLAFSLKYISEEQKLEFLQKTTQLSVKLNNFVNYLKKKV